MDRIIEDNAFTVARFACDCFDQRHNLEISIERDRKGKIFHFEMTLFLAGKTPLWWRIKQAFRCLKGEGGDLGEFILAPRDYSSFVEVVSQLVTYSWTASSREV